MLIKTRRILVPSKVISAFHSRPSLRKEVLLPLQRKGRGGKIIAGCVHGFVKPFLDYLYIFFLLYHGSLPLVIMSLRSWGHSQSFNICQDRGRKGALEPWWIMKTLGYVCTTQGSLTISLSLYWCTHSQTYTAGMCVSHLFLHFFHLSLFPPTLFPIRAAQLRVE